MMSHRNILIALGVVALLIAGYFAYKHFTAPAAPT